jgi:hypothetical protein
MTRPSETEDHGGGMLVNVTRLGHDVYVDSGVRAKDLADGLALYVTADARLLEAVPHHGGFLLVFRHYPAGEGEHGG